MNLKGLIGLAAGYIAGMALATRYRKEKKSSSDTFLDDVVDIHRSAYADVKNFVHMNFDDIHTWEDIQNRAQMGIDSLNEEFETMKTLVAEKIENKDVIIEKMKQLYNQRVEMLNQGREKAISLFTDMKEDVINKWIDGAKISLDVAYKKAQNFIDKLS